MNQGNLFFALRRLALVVMLAMAMAPLPAAAVLEQGTLFHSCGGVDSDRNIVCVSACRYDQTYDADPIGGNKRWSCPNSDVNNRCNPTFPEPNCHNRDRPWCKANGPFGVSLSCPVQDSEDPNDRICALDEMHVEETGECVPRVYPSSSGGGTHSDKKAAMAGIAAFSVAKFLQWLTPVLPAGVSLRPHANVDFRDGSAFTAANVTAEWRNFRVSAASAHNGYGWSRPSGRLDWRVEWAF